MLTVIYLNTPPLLKSPRLAKKLFDSWTINGRHDNSTD